MLNVPITPPRVPFLDERTGYVSRAWYNFFLSLNSLSGAISDGEASSDPLPLIASLDEAIRTAAQDAALQPVLSDMSGELAKQINSASFGGYSLISQVAELQKQIDGLLSAPITNSSAVAATLPKPTTYTSDFTVTTDAWSINNKSGSTCTVTLPSAASWAGRVITFKNLQPQALVSASNNVVPIDSASPGTSILLNVNGNWATMVSDGTNWVIMQDAPNNILLLE